MWSLYFQLTAAFLLLLFMFLSDVLHHSHPVCLTLTFHSGARVRACSLTQETGARFISSFTLENFYMCEEHSLVFPEAFGETRIHLMVQSEPHRQKAQSRSFILNKKANFVIGC